MASASQTKEDEEDHLHTRLADVRRESGKKPAHESRGEPEHDGGDHGEDQQPPVVIGEASPQGDDRPQIGDEAGSQDQLAEVGLVEAGLDHDGVDHGDGRRREGDAADHRRGPVPAADVTGIEYGPDERGGEAGDADGQTLLEEPAQDAGLDLRTGHEGEQDAAETRQELDPFVRLEAPVQTEYVILVEQESDVPRRGADENLDQGNAQLESNGDEAGKQCQPHPHGGDPPADFHDNSPPASTTQVQVCPARAQCCSAMRAIRFTPCGRNRPVLTVT